MRALDREVVDAVWAAVSALLPPRPAGRRRGHRPRVPDRLCFEGILIRLATGCSWVDAEALLGGRVSDTTLRARRDEWGAAGVFERLAAEALAAYDRVVGLDLSDVAVDGSAHKAPCGGEGTGRSPVDRRKLGWKWSVAADARGIPVAWAAGPANRHDLDLLEPTLEALGGLLPDVGTLHLDRGYDSARARALAARLGLDAVIPRQRRPHARDPRRDAARPFRLDRRWVVERTNSWLSNLGQLRRNTDRRTEHRLAQLALAVALLVAAKLIDWRDRWSP